MTDHLPDPKWGKPLAQPDEALLGRDVAGLTAGKARRVSIRGSEASNTSEDEALASMHISRARRLVVSEYLTKSWIRNKGGPAGKAEQSSLLERQFQACGKGGELQVRRVRPMWSTASLGGIPVRIKAAETGARLGVSTRRPTSI